MVNNMTDWTIHTNAGMTKQKMAEHKKIMNELMVEGFKELYPFEDHIHYSRRNQRKVSTLVSKGAPEVMAREIIKHLPFEMGSAIIYKKMLASYHYDSPDVLVRVFQKIGKENTYEKFVNHRVEFHRPTSPVFLQAKILLHMYDERAITYYQGFTKRFARGIAEQFVEDVYDWTRNPHILPTPEEIVEKYTNPETDVMLKYVFASLGPKHWVFNVLQPHFLEDTDPIIHQCLAFSTEDEKVLDKLSEDNDPWVRYLVAVNSHTSSDTLVKLCENSCERLMNDTNVNEREWSIVREILAHENFPLTELDKAFSWFNKLLGNSAMIVRFGEECDKNVYEVLSGIALSPNVSFDLSMKLVDYSGQAYSILFNLLANSEISSIVKELVLMNVEEVFKNDTRSMFESSRRSLYN